MTNAQTPPIDSAEFIVAYEGDALAEHTMSVRDLAPLFSRLGKPSIGRTICSTAIDLLFRLR